MIIKGLNEEKIKTISKIKQETEEILNYRLKSYEIFKNTEMLFCNDILYRVSPFFTV